MTEPGRRGSILIVEDDPAIVDLIRLHLGDQGYITDVMSEGDEAAVVERAADSDLVILDIMLPNADGLSICRRIREREIAVPVLMLTARSAEVDKVVGLELGADDYLTKPFSVRELVARVRALLRRSGRFSESGKPDEGGDIRDVGQLHIDLGERRVFIAGREVELTTKEFSLLSVLAQQPGRAFSRAELLNLVWGYQYDGYSHTVNSHINRLRAKLERETAAERYIETVWGYGYRLCDVAGDPEDGSEVR